MDARSVVSLSEVNGAHEMAFRGVRRRSNLVLTQLMF